MPVRNGGAHRNRGIVMPSPIGTSSGSFLTTKAVWNPLLELLEQRKVIPVIGPDVVLVDTDEHGRIPITQFLAKRTAELLELPAADADAGPETLNDVACRWSATGEPIAEVYAAVHEALLEQPLEPSEELVKLANIRAFDLYVTTTFDDLLERALDNARYDGKRVTRSYAYSPDRFEDIPDQKAGLAQASIPTVYHLLGKVSATPAYAVTDEDTLEYIHALQSENRRPNNLLEELGAHSLLIIGSGYGDWLARFFLRITKHKRLSLLEEPSNYMADERTRNDVAFKQFLRHFSKQTKVLDVVGVEFIDELASRWVDRQGNAQQEPVKQPSDERGVFISYAHEDFDTVHLLVDALRRVNVPVWFDRRTGDDDPGLSAGEDWDRKIETQITGASLFVPILSRNVITNDPRYFQKEWSIAAEFSKLYQREYIVPINIDNIDSSRDRLPRVFLARQWEALGGGTNEADRVALIIRDLYRKYQANRSNSV
jgi:hypothetical protein